MKRLLILICFVTSCINRSDVDTTNNSATEAATDKTLNVMPKLNHPETPDYLTSIHLLDSKLESFVVSGTKYEIINRVAKLDSNFEYNETSLSILIKKDRVIENEIFRYARFSTRDIKAGGTNKGFSYFRKVQIEDIPTKDSKKLLRFNFDYLPSAPGIQSVSFVTFDKDNIKKSEIYSINGQYITEGNTLKGVYWTGYFGVEIPLKITERKSDLIIEVDSAKVLQKGGFLMFPIDDNIKTARANEKITVIKNIPDSSPSPLIIDVKDGMNVELVYFAITGSSISDIIKNNSIALPKRDTIFQNYFDDGMFWLKFKIGEVEGWTKSQKHYSILGCSPAG